MTQNIEINPVRLLNDADLDIVVGGLDKGMTAFLIAAACSPPVLAGLILAEVILLGKSQPAE